MPVDHKFTAICLIVPSEKNTVFINNKEVPCNVFMMMVSKVFELMCIDDAYTNSKCIENGSHFTLRHFTQGIWCVWVCVCV